MNKIKYFLIVAFISLQVNNSYSQNISPKKIDHSEVSAELKESLTKFIKILNGEVKSDMKSLFPINDKSQIIQLPSDYPTPQTEKRPIGSQFEIQVVYGFGNDKIVVVYGVVGTQVKHDSATALWIKYKESWKLVKYGMSMKDILIGVPLDSD